MIVSGLVTFITTYPLLIHSLLVKKLDFPALAKYLRVVTVFSLVTFITAYPFPHWPSI